MENIMQIKNSANIDWNLTSEKAQILETKDTIIQFTTIQEVPRNYAFGPNVILQFCGGRLKCSHKITLKGNHTTIDAPITQIFEGDVNFDGTWYMPQAYPQWFGVTVYKDRADMKETTSVSAVDAINKAIALKKTGVVHLPAGFYLIDKTINVLLGIRLVGCQGNHRPADASLAGYATILVCASSFRMSNDTPKYMININISEDEQTIKYAQPVTSIEHMFFRIFEDTIPEQIPDSKIPIGIGMGLGAKIDNVNFQNIPIAVKSISAYIDAKQVINCSYDNYVEPAVTNMTEYKAGREPKKFEEPPYAFDLQGLGDALEFRHNLIHNNEQLGNYYALRLQSTGGAVVLDNIINADVEILNSKAVVLQGNHMEYGAQVRVHCSVATISTNYIEKRERPSIAIRGNQWGHVSKVELINNAFVCRSFYNLMGSSYQPGNFTSEKAKKFLAQLDNLSQYDILISKNADVTIKDCFRYWLSLPGISDMFPTGILIAKSSYEYDNIPDTSTSTDTENLTSFKEFNDYSYFLSLNARIHRLEIYDFRFSAKNIQTGVESRLIRANSNGVWLGDGTNDSRIKYVYQIQYIWDYERCILKHNNGGNHFIFLDDVGTEIECTPRVGRLGQPLILVDGVNNVMAVRLVRTKYVNNVTNLHNIQYVDIPLCGCSALYDNGSNVNGYRWRNTARPLLNSSNNSIVGVEFEGSNVVCRASSYATSSGEWQRGDLFVNTDNKSGNDWIVQVK